MRPERPDDDEDRQLSDDVWELAQKCWVKDPLLRPTAEGVCETISHLLELRDGAGVNPPYTAGPHDLGLPASRSPVSASDNSRTVMQPRRNLASGEKILPFARKFTLKGHTESILGLAFSPNGVHIISCSKDHTMRTWDAVAGSVLLVLQGHSSAVGSVTFSLNGMYIASGSEDNTVRMWDGKTGQCLSTFEGHTNHVGAVVFSPDAKRIASGSSDCTIRIWNTETGGTLSTLVRHASAIRSVAFSPDNTQIVSCSLDKTINVWNAITYANMFNINADDNLFVVSFSSNSKHVISGSYGGIVQIWDPQTGQLVSPQSPKPQVQSVRPMIPSLDGKWIVSNFADGKVRVSDARTGRIVSEPLEAHLGEEYECVAFSPDGKQVAWVSYDNVVEILACN